MTTARTRKTTEAAPAKAAAPTPEDHPSLEAALVALQKVLPIVPKRHTARVRGRDGSEGYSYDYADLADVTEAAMPLLTAHGLAFICAPRRCENNAYELKGRLSHVSGVGGDGDGILWGELPIVGRDAQAIGSAITYGRRYLLGSMTGLVTDTDDDGAHAAAAKDQRTEAPAPDPTPQTHPEMFAPNGQPWLTPDGKPNADALEPHQRKVFDGIGDLIGDEPGQFNAWHAKESLPTIRLMDEYQAAAALSKLQELVGNRPPA